MMNHKSSTRVGGATFVKTSIDADEKEEPGIEDTSDPRLKLNLSNLLGTAKLRKVKKGGNKS